MNNFENVKLTKDMYLSKKGFLGELEKKDPSTLYKGTENEGLDAFSRQLKRFDIKVKGQNSDTVESFFKTEDAKFLFPEYVKRSVLSGFSVCDKLSKIISSTTKINSLDYHPILIDVTKDDLVLREVSEGEKIPMTKVGLSEKSVTLKKKGRMLQASYEAIKFASLDIFSVALKQIGAMIATSEFEEAVDLLSQKNESDNLTTENFCYEDLLRLWSKFDSFDLTTIIASPLMMQKILNLPEFAGANNAVQFKEGGRLLTPFGAEIVRCNSLDENTIIGIDKNFALERIVASDVTTEFDKLIDRQLERATISQICGFSTIYDDAIWILKEEKPTDESTGD